MASLIETGRRRVLIQRVVPEIDGGEFPIKRIVGQHVTVSADVLTDGHDQLSCVLKHRKADEPIWNEVPMEALGNDRWRAEFRVAEVGRYRYTIEAWVDRFKSWQSDLKKRAAAGQPLDLALEVGADLVRGAVQRANGDDTADLRQWAEALVNGHGDNSHSAAELGLSDRLARRMFDYSDRRLSTIYSKELEVIVDRERAGYGAWYEMFPRSSSLEAGRPGTLRDCAERVPYIAAMGFDVLYLPPIHPIGRAHRKGKNGATAANSDDPGSPWAIGAEEGGHTAVHPELGTLDDFDRLLTVARQHGMEIAMDLAYQCSPDHPYVKDHPEWFRHRPDGSVQYAENPPKKYEDIYPFDFETDEWQALWEELKNVALFWVRRGVRILRVDNPHTKPFPFWRWLIEEIQAEFHDVVFLAEAFTRPKVMYDLAKLGFSQSYTYFTWRNTREQLAAYFTELTQTEVSEYFRPNLWTNTPDILTEYLQYGGRAAFMARLVLAATLAASYGIYGPAFELLEARAREPGSEEYLDSEKYQVRHWDLDDSKSLHDFIRRVNRIRRENPALQGNGGLCFHANDNDQLICYSKQTEDRANTILVVVNLDPNHVQSGWVDLSLDALDLPRDHPYQVHDLLGGARYLWQGQRNYVQLDPAMSPAHILLVRHRVRTEQQFEYFM
jgi:starch synthase (maltosyl-transferring)